MQQDYFIFFISFRQPFRKRSTGDTLRRHGGRRCPTGFRGISERPFCRGPEETLRDMFKRNYVFLKDRYNGTY